MDNVSLFFWIFNFNHHSNLLDDLMVFVTYYFIYISVLLMIILGIKGKINEKKALLLTILTIPIAILLIKGIHLFIHEPRPFITYNFTPLANGTFDLSFPSRHATIMAVIAFSYTYFKSKWSYLFLTLMLWVGLSRIYVGVHYPLDVIGGFIVGIISLMLAGQFIKLIKPRFFKL